MDDNATASPYLGEASKTFAPTADQVRSLLEVTGSARSRSGIRGRALILTLWASGARLSEVLSMRRVDLDGLGDPTCMDPRIRLWRAKRRPQGRPATTDTVALALWKTERRKRNQARIEDLERRAKGGDSRAKSDLAWIRLVAFHREHPDWDVVDRGVPESGVRLRGEGGQAAAAALRRWLHERDKLPGSRTPHAPLWVTTRRSTNAFRDGECSSEGSLLRGNAVRLWLARRADRCGLTDEVHRVEGEGKRFRPHMLRHSFAAMLWKQTRDMETVRRALGHSDQQTTSIYLRSLEVMDDGHEPEPEDPLARLESMDADELRKTLASLLSVAKAR